MHNLFADFLLFRVHPKVDALALVHPAHAVEH